MSWKNRLAGISDEDLAWANKLGEKYSGGTHGGMGTKGDAARHIALGYLAAKADESNDIVPAKALVQFREKEMLEAFPGYNSPDNKMDLHNNKIGFEMAPIHNDKESLEKTIDKLIANSVAIGTEENDEAVDIFKPIYIKSGYLPYSGSSYPVKNKRPTKIPLVK